MEIILKSLDIIIESQIWPDKKPSEVLKILLFVHSKGYLYTPTIDGKVQAVFCAYRVKDGDDLVTIPSIQDGDILYVPFLVSVEKDSNLFNVVRESCRIYLDDNPDIKEIIIEDKNNKIKRYKLGVTKNGQRQTVKST